MMKMSPRKSSPRRLTRSIILSSGSVLMNYRIKVKWRSTIFLWSHLSSLR